MPEEGRISYVSVVVFQVGRIAKHATVMFPEAVGWLAIYDRIGEAWLMSDGSPTFFNGKISNRLRVS